MLPLQVKRAIDMPQGGVSTEPRCAHPLRSSCVKKLTFSTLKTASDLPSYGSVSPHWHRSCRISTSVMHEV